MFDAMERKTLGLCTCWSKHSSGHHASSMHAMHSARESDSSFFGQSSRMVQFGALGGIPGALGGIRTPNVLIRSSSRTVFQGCPAAIRNGHLCALTSLFTGFALTAGGQL